jgi:hypothetical protein
MSAGSTDMDLLITLLSLQRGDRGFDLTDEMRAAFGIDSAAIARVVADGKSLPASR